MDAATQSAFLSLASLVLLAIYFLSEKDSSIWPVIAWPLIALPLWLVGEIVSLLLPWRRIQPRVPNPSLGYRRRARPWSRSLMSRSVLPALNRIVARLSVSVAAVWLSSPLRQEAVGSFDHIAGWSFWFAGIILALWAFTPGQHLLGGPNAAAQFWHWVDRAIPDFPTDHFAERLVRLRRLGIPVGEWPKSDTDALLNVPDDGLTWNEAPLKFLILDAAGRKDDARKLIPVLLQGDPPGHFDAIIRALDTAWYALDLEDPDGAHAILDAIPQHYLRAVAPFYPALLYARLLMCEGNWNGALHALSRLKAYRARARRPLWIDSEVARLEALAFQGWHAAQTATRTAEPNEVHDSTAFGMHADPSVRM